MNRINAKKVSFMRSVKIIETLDGKYVLKKIKNKNIKDTFRYLESKNFNNYLDYIDSQDDFAIYPYIISTVNDSNEKSLDLIEIIAFLHKKTEYTKTFSVDDIKKIFEEQNNQLDSLEKYYDGLRHSCEEDKYLSPSKYFFLRNSSWIFHSIKSSKFFLDKWYSIVSEKKTKRVCLIHGNLELDHFFDAEERYLISWDNSKNDMPIYDLIHFYNNNFDEISFYDLLKVYNSIFPMYEEEIYLLFSFMFLPKKITFNNNEIINVKNIYDIINYLKTSSEVVSNYHSSNSNGKSNDENK